jgi:hypothetical protein
MTPTGDLERHKRRKAASWWPLTAQPYRQSDLVYVLSKGSVLAKHE